MAPHLLIPPPCSAILRQIALCVRRPNPLAILVSNAFPHSTLHSQRCFHRVMFLTAVCPLGWELLMYYELYYLSYVLRGVGVHLPQLYSTCYPHWMVRTAADANWAVDTKKKTDSLAISLSAFDRAGSFTTVYQKAFADLVATRIEWAVSHYDRYTNDSNLPRSSSLDDQKARLRWIIQETNVLWPQLAPSIVPEYYPVDAAPGKQVYVGTSQTPLVLRQRVKYIEVKCRLQSDAEEGNVTIFSDRPHVDIISVAGLRKPPKPRKVRPPPTPGTRTGLRSAPKRAGSPDLERVVKREAMDVEINQDAEDEQEGESDYDSDSDEDIEQNTEARLPQNFTVQRSVATPRGRPVFQVDAMVTPTLPSPPSTGFYYCCKDDVSIAGTTNAFNVLDTNMNTFLGRLKTSWIELQNAITASSAVNPLSTDDEWFGWMDTALSGGATMSATGNQSGVTQMDMTASFGAGTIQFSTADLSKQFSGLPSDYTPSVSPLYNSDSQMLFALAGTSALNCTLSDILNFLGLTNTAVFAHFLDGTTSFTLDPTQATRSGVWFVADGKSLRIIALIETFAND